MYERINVNCVFFFFSGKFQKRNNDTHTYIDTHKSAEIATKSLELDLRYEMKKKHLVNIHKIWKDLNWLISKVLKAGKRTQKNILEYYERDVRMLNTHVLADNGISTKVTSFHLISFPLCITLYTFFVVFFLMFNFRVSKIISSNKKIKQVMDKCSFFRYQIFA